MSTTGTPVTRGVATAALFHAVTLAAAGKILYVMVPEGVVVQAGDTVAVSVLET